MGRVNEKIYDEKGRELKSIFYNIDDPTSKLYSESKRDEKGNITSDVDECGNYNSKTYLYQDDTSMVVKDGKGNKTSFGYKDGNLVSLSGNADGEELTNTMHYTVGLLTKVSNGDTNYNFTYDGIDRITAVDIDGRNYATIEYTLGQNGNCVYVILYIIIALFDSFLFKSLVFYYINISSLICFGIVTLILLIVVTFLSPMKGEK